MAEGGGDGDSDRVARMIELMFNRGEEVPKPLPRFSIRDDPLVLSIDNLATEDILLVAKFKNKAQWAKDPGSFKLHGVQDNTRGEKLARLLGYAMTAERRLRAKPKPKRSSKAPSKAAETKTGLTLAEVQRVCRVLFALVPAPHRTQIELDETDRLNDRVFDDEGRTEILYEVVMGTPVEALRIPEGHRRELARFLQSGKGAALLRDHKDAEERIGFYGAWRDGMIVLWRAGATL
jgi:hypothetical protein